MKTAGIFVVSILFALEALAGEGAKAPAPLPSWTGFYAGVNLGGLWSGNPAAIDWSSLSAPGGFSYRPSFALAPQSGFAWTTAPGLVGGGQAGYNWQITDKVVVGVEADFQGVSGGGNWSAGWAPGSSKAPGSLGSVRGRAGYLVTPNLQVFGTGGFSYGGEK